MRNDIQQDPLFILGNKRDSMIANFLINCLDKRKRGIPEIIFKIRSYFSFNVITLGWVLIKFRYCNAKQSTYFFTRKEKQELELTLKMFN